jgi:hypothetical protein
MQYAFEDKPYKWKAKEFYYGQLWFEFWKLMKGRINLKVLKLINPKK